VLAGEESLTSDNHDAEEVYLGLRTQRGLEISDEELSAAERWVKAGWAVLAKERGAARLRLTTTGWLRLDSLAADVAAQRSLSSPVA